MTRREALSVAAGTVIAMTQLADRAEATEAGDWSPAWRIIDATTGKALRSNALSAHLSRADAVFVGEQHDDPETHRVEYALLRLMHSTHGDRLTLAMEMFERDVQPALTDYVTGKTDEATFLKTSRPWPNYRTDYRPLIEYAREKHIPVLASNAPAPLVKQVGREGIGALDKAAPTDRAHVARFVLCPQGDEYARRFANAMNDGGGHNDGKGMDPAMIERFYQAQCVRDDTMAETVASAVASGHRILHVNGSFHSDAGLGTVARLRFRRPQRLNVLTIKVVALAAGEPAKPDTLRGEADLLIFVPDRKPQETKAV